MKNFQKWRKAKQASFDAGSMHFHKCSELSWGVVAGLLAEILRCRISTGQRKLSLTVSDENASIILLFLDEMKFAYMHPRSTSAKFYYVANKCEAAFFANLPSPNGKDVSSPSRLPSNVKNLNYEY